MKKIMFNEKYGLQQAVSNGSKTMTRRIVKFSDEDLVCVENFLSVKDYIVGKYATYKVGEIVAIAKRYKDIFTKEDFSMTPPNATLKDLTESAGWENKMFVSPLLMDEFIEITDVRFERLQDISDEDCMKEGVLLDESAPKCYRPFYTFKGSLDGDTPVGWHTPREAFASLIDKVSGKGTWGRNPWVMAYTFRSYYPNPKRIMQGTPTGGIKKGVIRWHEYID